MFPDMGVGGRPLDQILGAQFAIAIINVVLYLGVPVAMKISCWAVVGCAIVARQYTIATP